MRGFRYMVFGGYFRGFRVLFRSNPVFYDVIFYVNENGIGHRREHSGRGRPRVKSAGFCSGVICFFADLFWSIMDFFN